MTPNYENALAQVMALPISEQLKILSVLAKRLSQLEATDLALSSEDMQAGHIDEPLVPLSVLAARQRGGPFDFAAARREAAGIWPEEESIDDFLRTLREWRNQDEWRDLD